MAKLLRPTALERHAAFFDANGDGFVSISETRARLRELGLSPLLAAAFSLIVNSFLGPLTQGRLSLDIKLAYIHRGSHPHDTGLFDDSGTADEGAFEALFQGATTREPRDRLTEAELRAVIVSRVDKAGSFGAIASELSKLFSFLEVRVLLCLASDCTKAERGELVRAISRRMLRRFVSGQLFHLLARRRRRLLASTA